MDTRFVAQRISKASPAITGAYNAGIVAGTTDIVFKNSGRVMIHCKKSGAGACTVTFKTPPQIQGLDIADSTGTVPASTGDVMYGPFPPTTFNDSYSDMRFNFSEVTGLTFALYELWP